jgi:hypothetical protein
MSSTPAVYSQVCCAEKSFGVRDLCTYEIFAGG